jgi:hypothetical protein
VNREEEILFLMRNEFTREEAAELVHYKAAKKLHTRIQARLESENLYCEPILCLLQRSQEVLNSIKHRFSYPEAVQKHARLCEQLLDRTLYPPRSPTIPAPTLSVKRRIPKVDGFRLPRRLRLQNKQDLPAV